MVNPLYLFAASLGVGFLLPLIDTLGRRLSLTLLWATIAAWLAVSISWLVALLQGAAPESFGTAGFQAPLAIVLRVGLEEAAGIAALSIVGLLSAMAMGRSLRRAPLGGAITLLMALMGMSGIILTRDLFNLFVFLEIASIGTYGLIAFDDRPAALRSGFKYMVAGSVASLLYLIGVIFVYRFSDQLNLDAAAASSALSGGAGAVSVFFLLAALLIELKPFPANGWGIDVYETANPGVSALLSGASATALLLALWKIFPLLGPAHLNLVAATGLTTFVASNLAGARQTQARRMLGYSSVAQVGLVAAVMALDALYDFGGNTFVYLVAGGLLLNHLLAKTGLFLLSGAIGSRTGQLCPWGKAAAGILALALVGLPPFPGFWAKWTLIQALAGDGQWPLIALILGASLVEVFYVLRWFGSLVKGAGGLNSAGDTISDVGIVSAGGSADDRPSIVLGAGIAAPGVLSLLLLLSGVGFGMYLGVADPLLWAPFAAAALFFLIDGLDNRVKGILSLAALAGFSYFALFAQGPMDGLRMFFAVMLLGGGALFVFASLYKGGARRGLQPLLLASVVSLGAVLLADTPLEFFFAWETMTLFSWLLVLRGKKGERSSLAYIVFGLGGAFLLLAGLVAGGDPAWADLLIFAGLLVKAGALGVHVWLPGAYAEADDEVSGFLSASLSKAVVFAFLALLISRGLTVPLAPWSLRILGWIGLATALFGALYAIYQEDIKLTLAWSSMGQIGYVILAIALNSHQGWTTALYLGLNHFMYKGMLFLAIAGVLHRTGTRNMYEMGGLIKKMPFSFLSVLMAIIALSGVPPLTGFGGKWLLYSSLISQGWYLEAAVAFFSSAVAFLYLFRLIHTIFLGQPKPAQKDVREAPLVLLIPQGLLMVALFVLSAFPNLMLGPILKVVGEVFPPVLAFQGNTLVSPLGYWNGFLTMAVTIVVFALCFAWMLANLHNPQTVKQFNIVYAAERPYKPWTTHFAWNFYAPYERALGFLTKRRADRFWALVGTGVGALGGIARRLYTGNGQTYALHVVLYVAVLYLIMGVL